jgi:hypothetical protein
LLIDQRPVFRPHQRRAHAHDNPGDGCADLDQRDRPEAHAPAQHAYMDHAEHVDQHARRHRQRHRLYDWLAENHASTGARLPRPLPRRCRQAVEPEQPLPARGSSPAVAQLGTSRNSRNVATNPSNVATIARYPKSVGVRIRARTAVLPTHTQELERLRNESPRCCWRCGS